MIITMKEKSMVNDLTTGSVWRQLIVFALPFMLANLLQTLYTTVDAVIVGQFVGSEALAAVSTCGTLVEFYTLTGMGFATGGQIVVAQLVGKGDREAVSKSVGTLFTLLLGGGLILSLFCLMTLDWQMNLLNVPAESWVAGRYYTMTSACGFVLVYGYNCVSNILRGMGDSKRPLVFVAIASGMNIILDLLFVIGFHWGAFGAALATITGQGFSFVVSLIYLYRHREGFGFDFKPKSFIPTKKIAGVLTRIGSPMALQFSAIILSLLFVNSKINNYGVAAAAVTGIGTKLDNILRIVTNSMGTAGASMIAQCVGAGKRDRVPLVTNTILLVCVTGSTALALVVFFFPTQVFGLFNQEPAILEYGRMYRWVVLIVFVSMGFRSAYNAVVNGIGYTSLGLFSCLMDGVFARIGFAVLLGEVLAFGIMGFWIGSALAGVVSVAIGGIYYYSGRWKTRRLIT